MALALAQELVRQFNDSFGRDRETVPAVRRPDLNKRLVLEEAREVGEALDNGDVVNLAQELADLVYVCLSAADTCGIDLASVFMEIHASNMTKAGAPLRPDGKIMKGPNYRPPNVEACLRAQGWQKGENK